MAYSHKSKSKGMPALQLGALCQGTTRCNTPVNPVYKGDIPICDPSQELSFVSSNDPRARICWLKCGNLYISDRNILVQISWEDLDRQGFISGKVFSLGGRTCLIRVPTNDEWDAFTEMYHEENPVLNWYSVFSWTSPLDPRKSLASCRGCNEASLIRWSAPELRYNFIGFRPVLEIQKNAE